MSDTQDMLVEAAVTAAEALVAAGVDEARRGFVWRRLVLFLSGTGLWHSRGDLADDLYAAGESDPSLATVLRTLCGQGGGTKGGCGG